ncbi:hypothetical protein Ae201684P_004587 [Aphanomyces euteiches]|nr:hypothetical protein Ae201684P_004587 [Aphanomyces euteiches]
MAIDRNGGNAVGVSSLKLVRLIRILKLARIFRASRILARWNAVLGLPIAFTQLGKYVLIMIVLAHWMACLWATVPQLEPVGRSTWRTAYSANLDQMASQYIASLYWSVMTIGTIGYGDMPVESVAEKIVAIICMTIGCGAYSFIVGSVCGLVSSLDESTTEFNQQMDHLNVFMDRESIPQSMTYRLREFFLHSRDLLLHKHFSRVLGYLSPGLRGELSVYTAGEWIQMVYFLLGGPPGEHARFMTAICTRMSAELYPPQELVVRSGETTNKLYIISKGLVARNGNILRKGNFFGEDVILKHVESSMIFDTRTLTYTDTYTLSRDDMHAILATGSFPHKLRSIRRAAMFMALARRMKSLYIQLEAIKAVGKLTRDEQCLWMRLRLMGENAMGLHPHAHLAAAFACTTRALQHISKAKSADYRITIDDQVFVAVSLLNTCCQILDNTIRDRQFAKPE